MINGVELLLTNPLEAKNTTHKNTKTKYGKALFLIHQYVDVNVYVSPRRK